MTAMQQVRSVSSRWWFIATYRFAVVALVPLVGALAVWVLLTVNSTQISMAEMNVKLTTVISRVDSMEDANQIAISERVQLDKSRNEQTVSIATRLTRLETSSENLVKAIDRLVKIIDENPPARRAQ